MNSASTCSDVRTSDGYQLCLRLLRPGKGTPVLFVHALAMDGSLWTEVADNLQTHAPLYALDCRGHGRSDKPPGPYTTELFANDLLAVLSHLQAAEVHLVGCSMGATVAVAFAGRYPSRLASLTVIDGTACYGVDVAQTWEIRGMRPSLEGFASMLDFQLSRWFSDRYAVSGAIGVTRATTVFLKNDAAAYLETCRMLGQADEREALARYKGPALVLVGSQDYATPISMAQEMAAIMPNSELKVLDGLKHFTPIEAPETIAQEIDDLLRNVCALKAHCTR